LVPPDSAAGVATEGQLRQITAMHSIMPPGYSLRAKRTSLENELRQARAGELAGADKKQRARIEKEIRVEVNRLSGEHRLRIFPPGWVRWVHW
jgi:hypothetical protein